MTVEMPMMRVALVTLLVPDYDSGLRFFVDLLGFELVEDRPARASDGRAKRWVVVRPRHSETGLVLATPGDGDQAAAVGRQTAGRVAFFLRTDSFQATYHRLRGDGVRFLEEPRDEPYGRVAVFEDLSGNRWDLLGDADG